MAHGQKTEGFCREALERCKVPISSCQHPFGTRGIRPLSACQGCTESSTLRDGAGAGHTHSTPSLPPASAENGVSHSPLGFHHSLEAWSPALDKGPEQAARSKQGLLLQDGAPSHLHHHPMMLAPKITLGRGRWAGRQASVVGAKSHSSQHGWMMKPTLAQRRGLQAVSSSSGESQRSSVTSIQDAHFSVNRNQSVLSSGGKHRFGSNLLKCFKSQSPGVPVLYRSLFLLPLPPCCITLRSLHP